MYVFTHACMRGYWWSQHLQFSAAPWWWHHGTFRAAQLLPVQPTHWGLPLHWLAVPTSEDQAPLQHHAPSMEEVPHGVTAIRPPRGGGRYIRKRQREQERYMYKNSYLHTYYICTYVRSVQSGLSGVALFKGFTHTTMISPPSTLHY